MTWICWAEEGSLQETLQCKMLKPHPYFSTRLAIGSGPRWGEGLIVGGQRSGKNNISQYDIQTDDGQRFFALEEDLTAIPMPESVRTGLLTGVWQGVMRGLPG